ncbi:MAG: LysR family transcriptional regulator [Ketobacteraceae bacterium]|nr:LysR family transcriptional regulator [Ketobacteraceae bacterium]
MLNLIWVRSFLAVVQAGSFQAAAKRLGLAQPTISLHIQKLEEQLGTTLLERSRTSCRPTSKALAFLPHGESLMSLNQRAAKSVKTAIVRIGASSNIAIYLLQPYLKSYQNEHAEPFELTIEQNPRIADMLETGELDIGLMEWWDQREGFESRSWKWEPLVVIVAPDHPWAARKLIMREELQHVPLLGGEPGTGTGRLLSACFGHTWQPPSPTLQLGSTEAVKQAVKYGLGISLVLRACVESEIRDGSLIALPLDHPGLSKTLWIIWRKNPPLHGETVPSFVNHILGRSSRAGPGYAEI